MRNKKYFFQLYQGVVSELDEYEPIATTSIPSSGVITASTNTSPKLTLGKNCPMKYF